MRTMRLIASTNQTLLTLMLLFTWACTAAPVWPTSEPDLVQKYTEFSVPIRFYSAEPNSKQTKTIQCGEETLAVAIEPLMDEKSVVTIEHHTRRHLKQWIWVKRKSSPDMKSQMDVATMQQEVKIIFGKDAIIEPIGAPEEVLEYGLRIYFSNSGAQLLSQVSNQFAGKKLAFVIGDRCVSAPKIMGSIKSGQIELTSFNMTNDALSHLLNK